MANNGLLVNHARACGPCSSLDIQACGVDWENAVGKLVSSVSIALLKEIHLIAPLLLK